MRCLRPFVRCERTRLFLSISLREEKSAGGQLLRQLLPQPRDDNECRMTLWLGLLATASATVRQNDSAVDLGWYSTKESVVTEAKTVTERFVTEAAAVREEFGQRIASTVDTVAGIEQGDRRQFDASQWQYDREVRQCEGYTSCERCASNINCAWEHKRSAAVRWRDCGFDHIMPPYSSDCTQKCVHDGAVDRGITIRFAVSTITSFHMRPPAIDRLTVRACVCQAECPSSPDGPSLLLG